MANINDFSNEYANIKKITLLDGVELKTGKLGFGQQLVGSTAVQWIPSTGLHFKYNATGLGGFLVSITSAGNVGIGKPSPNSKLAVLGLPVYADNASAITGGLTAGDFYRTGGDPDLVCVVH